ncbi:hypothetical protein BpHYR1_019493 [Brachionus plicatilis]|uniref:Uncharacterized protein n=1 Tax=Brachionus plicatilis TaxID=10195 RepID=A0A3M7S1G1_BRAPC|nr:hypothetical protein BpHYR1_019493 [Brachionus plicatilis]
MTISVGWFSRTDRSLRRARGRYGIANLVLQGGIRLENRHLSFIFYSVSNKYDSFRLYGSPRCAEKISKRIGVKIDIGVVAVGCGPADISGEAGKVFEKLNPGCF